MSARDRILLGVVAAVAAVGLFWFAALSPRMHDASKLSDQVAQAHSRLAQAEADAQTALAAKAAFKSNYATIARLGKAVPVDDEVPSLVYQLDAASRATGADFRTIKLAGGNNGGPAAAAPAAPAAGKAGAPATQVAAVTLPPGASIGPAGFPSMPFSFTFTGNFFTLEHFLRKIGAFTKVSGQHIRVGGRLLTVDGISLTAAPEGFPHIQVSIAATAFLVPADQGLTAGATPGGPTAASTQGRGAAITTANAGVTP